MHKPGRWPAIIATLCSVLFVPLPVHAVNIGDPFPLFSQTNTLSDNACAELGIDCGKPFSLDALPQQVIVLEFLNVYCHTCREQVPIFNDMHAAIQADPDLRGKACIVGVAVGNSAEEVRDFQKEFGVRYPVLIDPEKGIFTATGNTQGTPHTYILRKEERRFIIDYHAGGVSSKDRYLSTIRFALRGTFTGTEPGNKATGFTLDDNGRAKTLASLTGKKIILYLPVDRQYPLAIDTRNTSRQIAVLQDIRQQFPDVVIMVVPPADIQITDVPQDALFSPPRAGAASGLQAYQREDEPTVYCINEYGRITFKGDAITLWNAELILKGREYKPTLEMPEADILARIRDKVTVLGKEVFTIEKHVMENRELVYVVTLSPKRLGEFVFARLESAPSLCDVCHDSHFLYLFDQEGVILDFVPLQLTKYGNVVWNEQDVDKILKRIRGKNLFSEFSFDPAVDAVTTATMTSSLIYECFDRAKTVFAEFKEYRFRSSHWHELCFQSICTLKQEADRRAGGADQPIDQHLLNALMATGDFDGCPLGGMYVVVDGNILCSIHGMHTGPCTPE